MKDLHFHKAAFNLTRLAIICWCMHAFDSNVAPFMRDNE